MSLDLMGILADILDLFIETNCAYHDQIVLSPRLRDLESMSKFF